MIRRRAFILPVVILLAFASSLVIAAALQRYGSQRLVVQRQIEEFKRHHAMLGAQAVIRQWLTRQDAAALTAAARSGLPAHKFALPDDLRITITVEDGQGPAKADLTGEVSPKKEWFENLLFRLPRDNPELIRRIGPTQISVNAAPWHVLAALREDGDDLADALVAERALQPLNGERFRAVLERLLTSAEEISEITRLVEFNPTLWRFVIEADDGSDMRVFTCYAEQNGGKALIHEWRERRDPADLQSGRTGDQPGSSIPRARSNGPAQAP